MAKEVLRSRDCVAGGKTVVKSVGSGDNCSLHWFCHLKNGGKHSTKPPGEWWGLNEIVRKSGIPHLAGGRNVVSLIYCSYNCWGGWYLLCMPIRLLLQFSNHTGAYHTPGSSQIPTLEHRVSLFPSTRVFLGLPLEPFYAVRLFGEL